MRKRLRTTILATSADFATVFEKSSLPANVGGTLTVGIDEHCCRGVSLHSLNDGDAVWSHYKERLSPALLAQMARCVGCGVLPSSLKKSPSLLGSFQPDGLEAARARHRDSPKSFACFLSHHKQVCAAEARLVKQQLESLLEANVFPRQVMTSHPYQ